MKNLITIGLFTIILTSASFGQTKNSKHMVLKFQKITEFNFDEKKRRYEAANTIVSEDSIFIDLNTILIKGYKGSPNKKLNIIKLQKEKGSDRDMYHCEMNGMRYGVAISPDQKYLTLIGINNKFIYELKKENR